MRSSLIFVLASLSASPVLADTCSPLHYIYARATTEVPTGITEKTTPEQWKTAAANWWSQGYGAAGGALWLNLTSTNSKTKVDGITGYAVPYPADMSRSNTEGQRSSPQIGIDMMVAELKSKSTACPKQKYILGGHSQGGGVTVGAIRKLATEQGLPKDAMDRIIAVTMFGSPPCPESVKNRCRSYCHKGDFACDPAAKGNAPNLAGLGKGKSGGGSITPTRRSTTADEPVACLKNVAETGYEAKTGSKTGAGPHLAYNADGYYIKAAACYIQERFKGGK